MPVTLPEQSSYETLIDYVVGVEAGLLADEATKAFAAPWTALLPQARKLRDTRDDTRHTTLRARARQRCLDALWDGDVTMMSGTAYLAAGKDVTKEPYKSTFGSVSAREATSFGPHRASAFGEGLIGAIKKLAHAAITPFLPAFEALNARVEAGADARDEAARTEALLGIDQDAFRAKVEKAAAKSEIQLLGVWIDRDNAKQLIRAVLAVPRPESPETQVVAPVAAPTP